MNINKLMQPGGGGDWRDEALCEGDDRFIHPDKTAGLKRICVECPVFDECLRWAVTYSVSGVFAAGKWRDTPIVEGWHGKVTGGLD